MKKVVIIPLSGLCNRMRSIASGVYIAKQCEAQQIEIRWNKSDECFCNFSDLFQIEKNGFIGADIKVVENRSFIYKTGKYHDVYQKLQIPLGKMIRSVIFDQCIDNFNKHRNGNIFNEVNRSAETLCLISCHSMANHYPLHSLFKPVDAIEKQINQVTALFGKHVIGLHIRGTDHKIAKANSTLDKFMQKIDSGCALQDTKFFLATDEQHVKQFFVEKYGDFIITRNNILERDSIAGMQDALVDLWCLSRTCKIIGSFGSSYTELAAELGGIPLEFAK